MQKLTVLFVNVPIVFTLMAYADEQPDASVEKEFERSPWFFTPL
jgi:hypothetical protein